MPIRQHSSPVGAFRVGILTVLLLAPVAAASAQETPEATFTETVDVELVNVEVWVSDQEGKRVSNLGPESFTLLHDGKPAPITHFSEIRDGAPVDRTGRAITPDLVTEPMPQEAAEAHLAVLFDTSRLTPGSQRRMARNLRSFIASERIPAERVLILRLESSLLVEAPFGSRASEIEKVLKRLEKRQTSTADLGVSAKQVAQAMQSLWTELNGQTGDASIRSIVGQITGPSAGQGASAGSTGGRVGAGTAAGASTGLACEDFVDRVEPIVVRWGERELVATRSSLNRLGDVASFLSGLEGPKTLLYLSDGLGIAPGAAATDFVRGVCPAYQTDLEVDTLPEELSRAFGRLARRASANQITIHSIHGSGLEGSLGGSVSQASSDNRGFRSFQKSFTSNGRRGLSLLAEETGGRVIAGRAELRKELEQIGDEMGTYYSLAYTPPKTSDGMDHRIDVEVGDGALETRHRRAYSDKTQDQWLTERLESALYLGLVDNPLAARLGAGNVSPTAESQYILPMHVVVPVDRLTFPLPDGHLPAQVAVRILALNTTDRAMMMTDRSFTLPRGGTGETVDLRLDIELAAGVYAVAVAVCDQIGGDTSFISTTIDIGETRPSS